MQPASMTEQLCQTQTATGGKLGGAAAEDSMAEHPLPPEGL
jgi:hypothetical protein